MIDTMIIVHDKKTEAMAKYLKNTVEQLCNINTGNRVIDGVTWKKEVKENNEPTVSSRQRIIYVGKSFTKIRKKKTTPMKIDGTHGVYFGHWGSEAIYYVEPLKKSDEIEKFLNDAKTLFEKIKIKAETDYPKDNYKSKTKAEKWLNGGLWLLDPTGSLFTAKTAVRHGISSAEYKENLRTLQYQYLAVRVATEFLNDFLKTGE